MPEINRQTNTSNMIWQLVDRETGAENAGDHLGLPSRRPGQDPTGQRDGSGPSDAPPVPHPRRGPVPGLSRDGEPEANFVWKDTVLLRANQTIDILLDVTNPGLWMAHCHIAEHTESGMMFSFDVAPATELRPCMGRKQARSLGRTRAPGLIWARSVFCPCGPVRVRRWGMAFCKSAHSGRHEV